MSLILALSGHAGAGKDTVADFLVTHHGFVKIGLADPLKRICKEVFDFSDTQLWGPSAERNKPDNRYLHIRQGKNGTTFLGDMDLIGTVFEKYKDKVIDGHLPSPPEDIYLSPRIALQTLGTEWGRHCHKDIWVNYCLRMAFKVLTGEGTYSAMEGLTGFAYKDAAGVVIPDARFKNEFIAIRAAGGKIVRIKMPLASEDSVGVKGHSSETEQNDVPDEFFNDVIDNTGTIADLYAKVELMFKEHFK